MNEKTLNIYYKRAMPGSQEIASGFFFFTCRTQVHQLCKVPPAAYFVKHHFNQYIYIIIIIIIITDLHISSPASRPNQIQR